MTTLFGRRVDVKVHFFLDGVRQGAAKRHTDACGRSVHTSNGVDLLV